MLDRRLLPRDAFLSPVREVAKRLAASGLGEKAQELLDLLAKDPFSKPPPIEK